MLKCSVSTRRYATANVTPDRAFVVTCFRMQIERWEHRSGNLGSSDMCNMQAVAVEAPSLGCWSFAGSPSGGHNGAPPSSFREMANSLQVGQLDSCNACNFVLMFSHVYLGRLPRFCGRLKPGSSRASRSRIGAHKLTILDPERDYYCTCLLEHIGNINDDSTT